MSAADEGAFHRRFGKYLAPEDDRLRIFRLLRARRQTQARALWERAGVNFSQVSGASLPPSASAGRPELAGRAFQAMGVSVVVHPRNPYVPIVHMNVRCFVAEKAGAATAWWFGGGMDLTPCYPFAEDARHFHRACREALAPYGTERYPRYKKWCDDYFYLRHRGEPRGAGRNDGDLVQFGDVPLLELGQIHDRFFSCRHLGHTLPYLLKCTGLQRTSLTSLLGN